MQNRKSINLPTEVPVELLLTCVFEFKDPGILGQFVFVLVLPGEQRMSQFVHWACVSCLKNEFSLLSCKLM